MIQDHKLWIEIQPNLECQNPVLVKSRAISATSASTVWLNMEQTQQMKDLEFTFLDVYKIYYGSILCKSVEKLEGRSNID